nr:hypothetical protein Iba_chr01cCG15400 [Ipomoea batatas]
MPGFILSALNHAKRREEKGFHRETYIVHPHLGKPKNNLGFTNKRGSFVIQHPETPATGSAPLTIPQNTKTHHSSNSHYSPEPKNGRKEKQKSFLFFSFPFLSSQLNGFHSF